MNREQYQSKRLQSNSQVKPEDKDKFAAEETEQNKLHDLRLQIKENVQKPVIKDKH